MNMKCGKCGGFAPLDTFKTVPGTNEFVCEDCFRDSSAPVTVCDAAAQSEPEEECGEEPEEDCKETISQKANRIWMQRQIDRLEQEQEILVAELDSLRDDIGYDRITMDEENCLVAETVYGFRIEDRLDEIEKELEQLRNAVNGRSD